MTARRKKPAKGAATKAVAKRTSSVIAKFNPDAHELGDHIEGRERTDLGADGNFISTKGGVFRVGDETYSELRGFILDDMLVNAFYEGAFDPNEPRGATCYAIGRDLASLAPPRELKSAVSETCKTCPNDVFGSAGKGKACKNTYRLLFVGDMDAEDGFKNPTVYTLSVPAASNKNYRQHQKALKRQGINQPWGVCTEISIHPGENGGHSLSFEPVGVVSGALARRLNEIGEQNEADLTQPPKLDENAGESRGKKPAKKGARKRRT